MTDFKRVAKPQFGFALWVPEDWVEEQVNLERGPTQVARFVHPDNETAGLTVSRDTSHPLSARATAESNAGALAEVGFASFEIADVTLAGREAARLRAQRWGSDGALVMRQWLLRTGTAILEVAVISRDPKTLDPVLEEMMARFEMIPFEVPSDLDNPITRYTSRARRVLYLARQLAGSNGQDWVRVEHLLAGLALEGDGVAHRVLDEAGVTAASLADLAASVPPPPDAERTRQREWTRAAAETLHRGALEEARRLDNSYIGTEHLLLGLLSQHDGPPAQLLRAAGADPASVAAGVRQMISGFSTPPQTTRSN